ncbi:cop-coated vesicle membrane p24 [Babesia ovis]|uniref:Cop-coated vesicle membrane p24 n=1 Tax=Babesia ovis TaxID=5869 RepID=A0A9W5TBU2_BABOV|nr:cop-coated vesicle membrane p24 [Babesia ovis]
MAAMRIAFAALVLAAVESVQALQILLEGLETRCFISPANKGETLTGTVEAIPEEHAARPLLFKVSGPTSEPTGLPLLMVVDNQFEHKVDLTGHYAFCITNTSNNKNTFLFNYRVESGFNQDLSGLSTVDDANDVLKFAEELLENTHVIVDRTETYSSREQLYSQILEDMNSRIIRWSTCQMIFLICICFFQIYYISSFFEVKSFV